MALQCQLRVMADDAWIGDQHTNVGRLGAPHEMYQALPRTAAAYLSLCNGRLGAHECSRTPQVMKAVGSDGHTPIVFLHGCCLTSKTWETTPDGRMGWYEYFTRKDFPTYLAEQSGRGRSGFNPSVFNEVREGKKPPGEQRRMLLATDEFAWGIFRFGPKMGQAWPDQQFPMDHVE